MDADAVLDNWSDIESDVSDVESSEESSSSSSDEEETDACGWKEVSGLWR